jgi:hypothetical protein
MPAPTWVLRSQLKPKPLGPRTKKVVVPHIHWACVPQALGGIGSLHLGIGVMLSLDCPSSFTCLSLDRPNHHELSWIGFMFVPKAELIAIRAISPFLNAPLSCCVGSNGTPSAPNTALCRCCRVPVAATRPCPTTRAVCSPPPQVGLCHGPTRERTEQTERWGSWNITRTFCFVPTDPALPGGQPAASKRVPVNNRPG